MIWKFNAFELDEARRELRLDGREVLIEPLIFDVLVELVRNRNQVVTKDQLLDRIWPGAIVTESSLQRAISLARSALREGGMADAIRTFPRRGYRFSAEVSENTALVTDTSTSAESSLALNARQYFDRDQWDEALATFQEADRTGELSGADLERAAWCHLNRGRPQEAVAWLERAASVHSSNSDTLGAARAVMLLCQVHLEGRRLTVAGGWQQRAVKLLADVAPCRELAQFEWVTGRLAFAQGGHNYCANACRTRIGARAHH